MHIADLFLVDRSKWSRWGCAVCSASSRDSSGGFFAGFVVGGAVFGAMGYLFAPQISKALLSDDQRLRLPRFLEEEKKSPEATKQAHAAACLLSTGTAAVPLPLRPPIKQSKCAEITRRNVSMCSPFNPSCNDVLREQILVVL